MTKPVELSPADLRSACDPSVFTFASTEELTPLNAVIGQHRAVQAIDFGLNMLSPGYNIFVTGIEGTGKTTIVQDIVGGHAEDKETPVDWCLINNFEDEFRPIAIAVPSGRAVHFSRGIQRLVESLQTRLPKAFEDSAFEDRKNEIQQRFEKQEQAIFKTLDETARGRKLAIHKASSGIQTIPLLDGKPMSREDFDALPEESREEINAAMTAMQEEIETALREVHKIRMAMGGEIERLFSQTAQFVVRDRLGLVKEEYAGFEGVAAYLEALEKDIVENVALFLPAGKPADEEAAALALSIQSPLRRYHVNILVDRSKTKGAPVVFEPNPTFRNVFGWIEKRAHMGAITTDFSMVQAGSLLQANGGFLIMEVESVLMNPIVWEGLKRSLLNKQLCIEDAASFDGQATATLRPAPIDLEVKVILLGGYDTFEILQNHDPRFNKIFKVRADFDYEVALSDEVLGQYAQFIARVVRENGLLHFTPAGVAAIIEFCKKFVAHQSKLSLRFGAVVGIIKEADYWARQAGAERVTEQHVYQAFEKYRFRYNLYEEKIHASYLDESLLIDVQGEAVGQVNALAVYQMGDISFGRPSRITAETFVGRSGVVNIEREAQMSGNTHDKGVLILSGYLGRTFARKQPLCLSVSITFEQSYSGVDGDSASSTELYAILSSLSGLPIRQGIAVTGSVNQKGSIQVIGGVNQKIEGFFDVCRSKGLTGDQGVLIPKANVQNLMLKRSVVDAVEQGQFHIYPVSCVEEGIEILTGTPAGQPDADGLYPEGTVYHKVQKRLAEDFAQFLRWRKAVDVLP